jgi:hypothetical protein
MDDSKGNITFPREGILAKTHTNIAFSLITIEEGILWHSKPISVENKRQRFFVGFCEGWK